MNESRVVGRGVDILVLEVHRVIILAELIHIGVNVGGVASIKVDTIVIARGAAHSSATVVTSTRGRAAVMVTVAGSAQGGTTVLRTPALAG